MASPPRRLYGFTATSSGPEPDPSIHVSLRPSVFSTEDAINFGDVEDFDLPDIDSALGTSALGSGDSVIDFFKPGDFVASPGNQPLGQESSSTSCSSEPENPLHMAVRKGSGKIVQLLLQHGADCNAKDGQGLTPLSHAIMKEQEDIVDMLLSHGAQVDFVDNYQRSPLHWTILKHQDRLLKVLIKHCEKNHEIINAYDIDGKTPLHLAISLGLDAAVEILLEAGADVTAPTKTLPTSR